MFESFKRKNLMSRFFHCYYLEQRIFHGSVLAPSDGFPIAEVRHYQRDLERLKGVNGISAARIIWRLHPTAIKSALGRRGAPRRPPPPQWPPWTLLASSSRDGWRRRGPLTRPRASQLEKRLAETESHMLLPLANSPLPHTSWRASGSV
jgi:hypothetical protein